ncbi:MAG: hypothetical protein LBH66_04080 [Oscillospiraceae bacterium]|jgi:hypothetical protein|nr:hypothetical protein [Oscillospiraceae bacterium]
MTADDHHTIEVAGDLCRIVNEIRRGLAPARTLIHREDARFLYTDSPPSRAGRELCARFGLVFVEPDALDWTDRACEEWISLTESWAPPDDPPALEADALFLRNCGGMAVSTNPIGDYTPLKRALKLLAMPEGMRAERLPGAIARLRQDCAVSMRVRDVRAARAAAILLERGLTETSLRSSSRPRR